MPDVEQENSFVEAFVLPERRDRYKQLLANRKRRFEFLDRLNYAFDYIPSLAQQAPGNQHSVEGVMQLLNQHGMRDTDFVDNAGTH